MSVLLSYVMKMRQKLNIYNLSLILNAFATLAPDNPKHLADLGPELHDRLSAAVNTETFRVTPEKIGEMEGKVEELLRTAAQIQADDRVGACRAANPDHGPVCGGREREERKGGAGDRG